MGAYLLDAVGALVPENELTRTTIVQSWVPEAIWRDGWLQAASHVFTQDVESRQTNRRITTPKPWTIKDQTTYQKVSLKLKAVRAVYVVHMKGVWATGAKRVDLSQMMTNGQKYSTQTGFTPRMCLHIVIQR